jgi:DNA polymerase-3 subunit delta'
MFDKIIGNEDTKTRLQRLVGTGRVPNSILFAGPDGIGKRRFAIELSKALICPDRSGGDACDVCPVCRRAETFNFPKWDDRDAHKRVIFSGHPDVGTIIPYNRNISVDAIRHLETEANFRPYEAAGRFFIIDDADRMNDAAANALLKTLEEPPPGTHIFLITSRPDSLLPTIRSRCQTFRLRPVERPALEEFLVRERAFTTDEAKLAAGIACGDVSRAVSLDLAKWSARRDRIIAIAGAAVRDHDLATLLKISEEMNDAKNKEFLEEDIDTLEALLHDVWLIRCGSDASKVANPDLFENLSDLAKMPPSVEIPSWLAAIEEMRGNFAVNINRKIATDALFAHMCSAGA